LLKILHDVAKKSHIRKIQKKQPRSIGPSKTLTKYMKETLRVSKFREKKIEGGRVTVMDEREIRKNDCRRRYVLNNHIFRSLADLIYFFEFLNNNPELIDKFVDDIEDLLGLHLGADEYTDLEGVHIRHDNIKYQNFARLIKSILGSHAPKHDEDIRFYFQRYCMRIMQDAVRLKIGAFTTRDKEHDARGRSHINEIMYRAATYAEYYTNRLTSQEQREVTESREPSRIIE
jgi:hypothetical protein